MTVKTVQLTGLRDQRYEPFINTSVWNIPRAEEATFEANATDPITSGLHVLKNGAEIGTFINQDPFSHPVYFAQWSDPFRRFASRQTSHGVRPSEYLPQGGLRNIRVPANAVAAVGSDSHLHIIHPSGLVIDEFISVHPDTGSPGNYTFNRHVRVSLTGTGVGPQGGVRAWGGPAIGGLVREHEVDPNHPRYTGHINHAIAIALDGSQLFKTPNLGTTAFGYNSSGFSTPTNGGYVSPATEQDANYGTAYTGVIPMGQYFFIPSSVNLATQGLSPQGFMLAEAMQDYGAYVTDQTVGSFVVAYVDPKAPQAWRVALAANSASDREKIRDLLRAGTNNSGTNPGGAAPSGGTRRKPLKSAVFNPIVSKLVA
jgi:hypothetical protein